MTEQGQTTYNGRQMRIGLVSDTHVPEAEKELPQELLAALQGVDLILHAGDIYIPSVLDTLENIAPVLAARGDDDYGATLIDKRVDEKHVLQIGGKTLWLVHQRPYYLASSWWDNKVSTGEINNPDIVVFGHEHRTDVQRMNGVLMVNPGSPTFLNYRHGLGTIGLLDIVDGTAEATIIQL